jgi:large subunit ribosomal protein L24
MQKVLRRSAAVKRRADKKTTDHAVQNAKVKWNVQRRQDLIVRRQITNDILAERKRRREEWELGPLAPKRDVGDSKDSYGTVDAGRIKGSEVHPSQRTKRWNIVEGDRVVIIEGRDKGQIGLVTSTDRNTEEVTVRGFNMASLILAGSCAFLVMLI